MKFLRFGVLPLSLSLVACDTMTQPISSGSFDPLSAPGSTVKKAAENGASSDYKPGEFVTAIVPHTAFYNQKPGENQDADKILEQGTQMKIISVLPNLVKVELDNGNVGFVPTVMVGTPGADSDEDLFPIDGTYQVYPPLPGGDPNAPLPVIDLEGLPPEGAIPTVIDPNEPAPVPSSPTIDSLPGALPEPAPADEADPVKEAVRKKVEAAMKAKEEAEGEAAE